MVCTRLQPDLSAISWRLCAETCSSNSITTSPLADSACTGRLPSRLLNGRAADCSPCDAFESSVCLLALLLLTSPMLSCCCCSRAARCHSAVPPYSLKNSALV